VPAIVDDGITVFDSNAILLYLAEKTGQFLPGTALKARGEMLSWLMFVASGIGPYSGQAVHFRTYAPKPNDYAVNRYTFEAERHWKILEDRLAAHRFVCGETYTIVDMAVWGWSRLIPNVIGQEAGAKLPNLQRHLAEISARPAAVRALALKEKHSFKTEMDEAARLSMFPHLKVA
jgi:GST-like protein